MGAIEDQIQIITDAQLAINEAQIILDQLVADRDALQPLTDYFIAVAAIKAEYDALNIGAAEASSQIRDLLV